MNEYVSQCLVCIDMFQLLPPSVYCELFSIICNKCDDFSHSYFMRNCV